jgi:hypothetical protein
MTWARTRARAEAPQPAGAPAGGRHASRLGANRVRGMDKPITYLFHTNFLVSARSPFRMSR